VGPPPPPRVAIAVVAPLELMTASMFSASEFSESGVADLVPSLSSPPLSLAKRAAATASQEEAGAGGAFIMLWGAGRRNEVGSSFSRSLRK